MGGDRELREASTQDFDAGEGVSELLSRVGNCAEVDLGHGAARQLE